MKNSKTLTVSALAAVALFSVYSCNNDDDPNPDIIWSIPLSAKFENPAPAGRTETGLLTMQLYGTRLRYSFKVDNLAAGDQLTMAHFHTGDPVNNGPVIQPFPSFTGTTSSGEMTIRQTLADSLKNTANEIYFNVHSNQVASGLVRGSVNSDYLVAADVDLTGASEVPPVPTVATGKALIRLMIDRKLYSLVTVTGVPPGDAVTMAHIHKGATGANGDVLVGLCASAADFGVAKMTQLDEANANAVRTDPVYVNVHSTLFPNGMIRGQIR
jgi:hypothetical protein